MLTKRTKSTCYKINVNFQESHIYMDLINVNFRVVYVYENLLKQIWFLFIIIFISYKTKQRPTTGLKAKYR